METQEQLIGQIGQLQTAVSEMKTAFTSALHQLSINPRPPPSDPSLTQMDPSTTQQDNTANLPGGGTSSKEHTRVLMVVKELKEELGGVSASIRHLKEGQDAARHHLLQLLDERDILLDELCRTGSLSEQTRQQLDHRFPTRTPSGCHSNDSGVGPSLEKMGWCGPSDQGVALLPDGPLVSTMVQDYVNGLGRGGDSYESDSSLSLAVTKSVTLSSTLSKRRALELDELSALEAQTRSDDDSPMEADDSPADSPADSPGPDPRESDPGHETERVKVTRELADTERRYCSILWTVQDTFSEPLSSAGLLTGEQHSALFPAVTHQLYEKHCRLLHALEARLSAWHWQPQVGDLLSRFLSSGDQEVLQMYTEYVNGFPGLLKTFYRLCQTSSEFGQFLKNQQYHPSCNGLDLAALLLSPVQRVPRYVLLLQQLLRHTPEQHSDHQQLQLVLQQLRTFLAELNGSLEHSFQLVAVHVSARELNARLSRPPGRRHHRSDQLWTEAGDLTTLRRRPKLKPSTGQKCRSSSGVDRRESYSSGEIGDYAERSATVNKKTRRAHDGKVLYDCKSLPHVKQRRRGQLLAARSETTLRDAESNAAHRHSAVDLQTDPSSGVKQRLQFETRTTDVSVCVDPVSPLRQSPPPDSIKAGSSQTLPRGRRLTVTRDGRSVTPEQRHPSADPPSKNDRRRDAIRTFKNIFSLKKRVSRSGTLAISDGSREVHLHRSDQYTPIRDASVTMETDSMFRSTQ